jgi:hypothetical protein
MPERSPDGSQIPQISSRDQMMRAARGDSDGVGNGKRVIDRKAAEVFSKATPTKKVREWAERDGARNDTDGERPRAERRKIASPEIHASFL